MGWALHAYNSKWAIRCPIRSEPFARKFVCRSLCVTSFHRFKLYSPCTIHCIQHYMHAGCMYVYILIPLCTDVHGKVYTHYTNAPVVYHGLVGVQKYKFTVHRPHACVCMCDCMSYKYCCRVSKRLCYELCAHSIMKTLQYSVHSECSGLKWLHWAKWFYVEIRQSHITTPSCVLHKGRMPFLKYTLVVKVWPGPATL